MRVEISAQVMNAGPDAGSVFFVAVTEIYERSYRGVGHTEDEAIEALKHTIEAQTFGQAMLPEGYPKTIEVDWET